MEDFGGGPGMPHFWLAQGMARALGLNLCTAIRRGSLTREGLDRIVAACGQCGRENECLNWLGRKAAGSEAPPAFCAIRGALAEVKLREGPEKPRPS